MKTKKYFLRVYLNDEISTEIELTLKQYKEQFTRLQEETERVNGDPLYIKNYGECEKDTYKEEHENYTFTKTIFNSTNISYIVLVKLECKEGYYFKKQGDNLAPL